MRRTLATGVSWTVFISAIYLFLGFRPAPPQTIGAGEVCFRCHRVITSARLAAEIIDGNLPTKYKTTGCMAVYAAAHLGSGSRYYVTDFTSGGLIQAEHAWFVPVVINDTTNERDYRAYYSRGMAQITAQVLHVPVIRWSDVIERARSRA